MNGRRHVNLSDHNRCASILLRGRLSSFELDLTAAPRVERNTVSTHLCILSDSIKNFLRALRDPGNTDYLQSPSVDASNIYNNQTR